MLLFAGVILLLLGLLSGSVLVLAPLGLVPAEPGLTLWATLPVLCLIGFSMVAAHARPAQVRLVSLAASAVLLLLALVSVGALVLGAASLVPVPADTASLWFVLVVGEALGSIGAASFARATVQTET